MTKMKKTILSILILFPIAVCFSITAAAADPTWDEIKTAAKGQTVYWNAWAGSEPTNDYIDWVADRVEADYGVDLRHVKISNTAESVSRVLAEKTAEKDKGGSIDLIWINGENFLAMKENGLLYGPFTHLLPNYKLVDVEGKPTTVIDFTVPVDGMESPWTMAQIVFMYDTSRVKNPPRTIPAFVDWAKANPGRFTHPQVRNFLGSTFLKQALIELVEDPKILQKPATKKSFEKVTAPLWKWYEQLKPNLWRKGEQFPESGPAQLQLLTDGEIDMSLSFSPAEASSHIAGGLLPDTVRTFVLDGGTIGNTSFVAIPYNASAKEGAMVVADFLLSPEAQARGQNAEIRGVFTVLDLDKLKPEDRALFDDLPRGAATLSNEELGVPQLEPHPSWMNMIVAEWPKRYSK